MAHERKLIRDAIKARLIGASTAAGARVFTSRYSPLQPDEMPGIVVVIPEEPVSDDSKNSAPRELKRTAIVKIAAWLTADEEDLDDDLDALALEVETAMDADPNFHEDPEDGETALVHDSILKSSEFLVDMSGDKPAGCVLLEYAVTYFSPLRKSEPEAEFDTADVKITSTDGGETTINEENQIHDHRTGIYAGG